MTLPSLSLYYGGLDYQQTPLAVREQFAFTSSQEESFYHWILSQEGVRGSVLLSTCNRLELYLSMEEGYSPSIPSLLCQFLHRDPQKETAVFHQLEGYSVFAHLSLLSAGMKSQIFGEEQIISQVRLAQTQARLAKAMDSYLEVLFRLAITCGKKIRSQVPLHQRDTSLSHQVAQHIVAHKGKSVLVIGNGEMARHVSSTLLAHGLEVAMTLRRHGQGLPSIPQGVTTIPYTQRYHHLSQVDAVVSATRSPHFTLLYEEYSAIAPYPTLLFDLAVPRDIQGDIASLSGVLLFHVDDLRQSPSPWRETLLAQAMPLVEKYQQDYIHWLVGKQQGESA